MKYKLLILTYFIFYSVNGLFGQVPTWTYGISFGGTDLDLLQDMCIDRSNNIIMVGPFYSTDLQIGPFTLSSNGIDDIFVSKFDNSGNVIWAKSFGGNGYDAVMAVASDDSDNIYITGSFDSDSIQFDGSELFKTGITNMFIVKLDENGNVLWAKQSYNSITCGAICLTINHSGDLFLTAEAGDSLVLFDQDSIHITQVPGGVVSLLFKLNRNGNIIWRKVIKGPGRNDWPLISSDGFGNSYLFFHSGTHSVTIDTTQLMSNSYSNVYIVKFDSIGNFVFASIIAGFGGLGGVQNREIISDSIGNFYVVGNSEADSLDFGQFLLTNVHSNEDAFVAKFNNVGTPIWAKYFGGNSSDFGLNVAINPDGGPTMVGAYYSHSIVIDSVLLINHGSSYTDIFMARFDSTGNIVYAIDYGGALQDYSSSLIIDNDGIYYLGAQTHSDTIVFNNLSLLNNTGSFDILLLKSDFPSGIESIEGELNGKITLFPNPSNGQFQLNCNQSIEKITISDVFGRIVFTSEEKDSSLHGYRFDLKNRGMYIMTVQIKNEQLSGKIIIE
ncbi:MAG: T9SS type A sorting domain-containing protein [Bacteroidetes bacterium]|nr:T9SS type A sorting domain-containing protein [Bacteroidota bacterium]MBL0064608.1 T9SS type A sorting domain-containing protein [Bacteroidota bacterium]